MVVDYSKGKIYKIISNSNPELVYYGSTCQSLSKRMGLHRSNCRRWLDNKAHYMSSFDLIQHGDAQIVLIENYPCSNKEELFAREQFYIGNNPCVNKIPAHCDIETRRMHCRENLRRWRERNPTHSEEYYQKNREHILEKCKEYRENNIEIVHERHKKYRENNADKEKERHVNYYQENKDTILEKCKEYREDNKEKERLRHKKYQQENRDKINAYKRAWRAKLKLDVKSKQKEQPETM